MVTTFTGNIECGAHDLLWTPSGGSQVNLGATQDGSVLHIEADVFERTVHRFGKTPYEVRATGLKVWVEAIMLNRSYENFETLLDGVLTNDTTGGATDTLNGGIDADDTIITLNDMTGFTEPGNHGFVVRIGTEDILVRGVNLVGETLGTATSPCERGYNGTTAASHLTGATVTFCNTIVDTDPRPKARTKGRLTLRPIGAEDDTDSFTLWLAELLPKFDVAIRVDQDQGFKTEFRGIIEESAGRVRLLRIGKLDVLEAEKSYFAQTE